MKKFGTRLEALRGSKTQKEFATLCGIPLNTYTNWVRGIREPSASALIKLCTQLDVSSDWLLGLSDIQESTSSVAPAKSKLNPFEPKIDLLTEIAAMKKRMEELEAYAVKYLNKELVACCG